MAVVHRWVVAWLAVSTLVVLWDASYCLFVWPNIWTGGWDQPFYWLFTPYKKYATIDYVYGKYAFVNHEGFTRAQACMNLVESAFNFWYLYLVSRKHVAATLIGFTGSLLTVGKTILYFLNEYFSGFAHIRHNDWPTLIVYYIFPNGLWIVFPTLITFVLGRELWTQLQVSGSVRKSKKRA